MERPPARSVRAYLRSPPIVAPAVPGHRHVSSTARSRHACSGYLTKIILRSDASKSTLTCASGVRSVRAKALMERFLMVVRGTRSKWFRPTTGKPYTGSHFRTRRPHLQRSFSRRFTQMNADHYSLIGVHLRLSAANNTFRREGCLFLHSGGSVG